MNPENSDTSDRSGACFYHSGDAISAILGLDLSRSFYAAYAYDFNLSELNKTCFSVKFEMNIVAL